MPLKKGGIFSDYFIEDHLMKNTLKQRTAVITWDQIRRDVARVNPELYRIIDALSPGKNYKLLKATYHFGDLIVDAGQINIPYENTLISLKQFCAEKRLGAHFLYSPIPLGLLLNRSCEVFVSAMDRAIPLNLLKKGALFGVFEVMSYLTHLPAVPIWQVSSGARTIFTLPKIANTHGMNRLCAHYHLSPSLKTPALSEQWLLMKAIAQAPAFENVWLNDIVFFSESWFQHKSDPAWIDFYHYLYKTSWQQSQYAVGKVIFALHWQKFIQVVSKRHLKPRPYLSDTIKHLFLMLSNAAPGIVFNQDDEDVAPTHGIQHALLDVYQLKNYFPTLLNIGPVNALDQQVPIYYSLSYPTLLEGHPQDTTSSTIMLDIRDIKRLIETLHMNRHEGEDHLINEVTFNFFHVDDDKYHDILPSKKITDYDPSLLNQVSNSDQSFCYSSAFWKGCIRIAKKQPDKPKSS